MLGLIKGCNLNSFENNDGSTGWYYNIEVEALNLDDNTYAKCAMVMSKRYHSEYEAIIGLNKNLESITSSSLKEYV